MIEEPVKRKRGRPKKVKLPDEVQDKVTEVLLEIKDKEEQEVHNFVEQYKAEKRKGDWDITSEEILNMKVPFFDAELSYELTPNRRRSGPETRGEKDTGRQKKGDYEYEEVFVASACVCAVPHVSGGHGPCRAGRECQRKRS